MSFQPPAMLYTQGFGSRPENVEIPVITNVNPTSVNTNYPLGKRWINTLTNSEFVLTNFTTSSGITTATWTLAAGNADFPITQFVVGPAGSAGYQTIQSALNAANVAGGGIVYVQPGTYTENLMLYGNTEIVGTPGNSDSGTSGNCTIIVGVHTPPLSGSFTFANVRLNSATDIFFSTGAGSANLVLINVYIVITNGFIFNLTNWTGGLVTYNVGDGSANNGVVTNTGGALCFFVSATHGAGTGKTMLTSGLVEMQEVDLNCPWNAATGTTIACDYNIYTQTVTCSNNSTGALNWCRFSTSATPALTMSSSAAVKMNGCVLDSSNNPAISGSGAGTLTLNGISFLNNSACANTLTLSTTPFITGEHRIGGDTGGQLGFTSITNSNSSTISTGVGSVKMSSANPGTNTAWIKIYIGTTAYWIPAWTTNSP